MGCELHFVIASTNHKMVSLKTTFLVRGTLFIKKFGMVRWKAHLLGFSAVTLLVLFHQVWQAPTPPLPLPQHKLTHCQSISMGNVILPLSYLAGSTFRDCIFMSFLAASPESTKPVLSGQDHPVTHGCPGTCWRKSNAEGMEKKNLPA